MGFFRFRVVYCCFTIVAAVIPSLASSEFELPINSRSDASGILDRALKKADLNNWIDAEPLFRQAESEARRIGDRRALTLARLGVIRATAQQRNLPQTSAELEHDLDVDPLLRSDERLRLFCLTIKATIDGEMQSSSARKDWEQVAQIAKELGDAKWQYRSTAGLGMAAFYSGDLATARKNIIAGLMAATQNHDVGAEVQYLYAVASGLAASQMQVQSISYFDKAIGLALSTPDAGYPALVYLGKADALVSSGKVEEATEITNEVLGKVHEPHEAVYEATTLVTMSGIDRKRGNFDAATSDLERSVAICRRGGFIRNLVQADLLLADLYRERKDLVKAETALSEAISLAQSNGDLSTLPDRLRTLAELQTARGNFAMAEQTYERASTFVDAMIASDPAVLDKTAWITLASRLYVEHFTLLAEHGGKPEKAFSVVEQVRGRVITDVLLAGGSTASDNARQTEESISKARFQLSRAKTTGDVRKIRDELFLLAQHRWIDPDVSAMKAQAIAHVQLSQVQRAMAPHSVILEYVLAEPRSYCLAIRSGSARILSIGPKSVIDDSVTAFLKLVKSKEASATAARHLDDLLLTPVNELGDAQNVLVVRDGLLNLLPFDALEDSRGAAFGDIKVVSYLPSAASFYLIASHAPPSGARENLFAVGDIPYAGTSDSASAASAKRDANESRLSNLPTSKEEVLSAAAAFDDQRTTLLMGSTGTKAAVEKADLKDYRVLHFAVHGIGNETHPDQAALVFLSDPTTREDGLLSATEVAQLRLHANLVVLSACDTAVGPIEGQEGIANLSRAFLLAGARSVISTLWAVDDNFSLALLKDFYKDYRRTGSPAESLALAKRTMLARFGKAALPYYWAAFTFEGVPESAIAHHAQHNRTTKSSLIAR